MSAAGLIGNNTLDDFNGSLDEPRKPFRDPDYPHFEIIAAGCGQGERLLRRFFL